MTWTIPWSSVVQVVERDAELVAVVAKRVDLLLRDRVDDRQAAVGRGDVVVDGGDRPLGPAHLAAGEPQSLERLGAGHFVDQVQVDVEDRLPPRLFEHDVVVPDFFKQRARTLAHTSWLQTCPIKCYLNSNKTSQRRARFGPSLELDGTPMIVACTGPTGKWTG